MGCELVLLHSPLVGPSTWDLLHPLLAARGHDVIVPDYTGVMRGDGPYYPAIIDVIRRALPADDAPTIMVGHSGAGALLPAACSLLPDTAALFVDAVLPYPGRRWFDTASDDLKAHLHAMNDSGRLPPWHRWWPDGALAQLLGSEETVSRFTAGAGALPFAYFEERAPDVRAPSPDRCAYFQLSAAYDAEASAAKRKGWRVQQLMRNHLAMLTHPEDTAAGIESAARALAL